MNHTKYPQRRQDTRLWTGFTLVELLVAIGIIGLISVVGVQSLYDIVSVRSAQRSIEDSSDALRVLTRTITRSVVGAQSVSVVTAHELQVVGSDSCQTYRYDSGEQAVKLAQEPSYPCTPPSSGFGTITPAELLITSFSFSPTGDNVPVVTIEAEGTYQDSLVPRITKFKTTATPRN